MSAAGVRWVRVGGVTLVAAGALWLFTFGTGVPEVRPSAPGGYPLPEFRLPALNAGLFAGDTTYVASDELRGNVALVTFWATWCKPCIAEQPSLLALQEELDGDGLRVLGVLHLDSPEAAFEWLTANGRLDLRSVVGSRAFATASRGAGLPSTLLVDRRGEVREIFFGYWPGRDPYVRDRVKALLDEKASS
jgi:thiol-disulfide isomerase/thioredoxin